MTKNKITYYLGAGVSVDTIPVVEKFTDDMDSIAGLIDHFIHGGKSHSAKDPNLYFKEDGKSRYKLYEDLKSLKSILSEHASFDTYARIQYLRKNYQDLKRLKYMLSLYLILLQLMKKTNKRYESFLASIAEVDDNSSKLSLPENVNFISWNYDMQLEKAITELMGHEAHNTVYQILNVMPSIYNVLKEENPFLIKLNGTASFHYIFDQSRDFVEYLFSKRNFNGIKELLNYYEDIIANPLMNAPFAFSWEREDSMVESCREKAKELMSQTNILVTIGYSFPVFNRKIDRELLNMGKNITKIYVQNLDNSGIIVRLSSLIDRPIDIVSITDVSQFYIPFELV
ncbi:hypothetical protein [Leptospira dzoumogneensis]|uniref:SIR2-like domain-containing protein n=1 Tax=Leptospira dzoumogneensis TaxID=2484904 RepID=A0A4Z1AL09_9LEPT|nr:hypothetical protein [Leptospira dzoumogneensis]TGN00020.1 hypothetical protein EHR06_07825 [Leptospira dzoumogneensis]